MQCKTIAVSVFCASFTTYASHQMAPQSFLLSYCSSPQTSHPCSILWIVFVSLIYYFSIVICFSISIFKHYNHSGEEPGFFKTYKKLRSCYPASISTFVHPCLDLMNILCSYHLHLHPIPDVNTSFWMLNFFTLVNHLVLYYLIFMSLWLSISSC